MGRGRWSGSAVAPPQPKIALVRLSSLGDVIHSLPVAHALRLRFPDARLTWLVERREAAILEGNPDLDHVVPVDTRLWRREFRRVGGPRAVFVKVRGLGRRLRAGQFDLALDLQGLWKSGVITALSRAPVRVGFALGACREAANVLFTNRRVPVDRGSHVVEQNLALLSAVGIAREEIGTPVFPITVDSAAERAIGRYLDLEGIEPGETLVVLNPGSGGEQKRWPGDAYARLGDGLSRTLEARVAVSWGPGEEPLARAIAHGMRATPLVLPPTTIPELAALLRRAAVVVGGDTGPVHIAAALGVPTVGLYGPTRARRNGPYGPGSVVVESADGRMDAIGVAEVLATASRVARERAPVALPPRLDG